MDYISSDRIEAIRKIRGEIEALRGRERRLSRPLLTSYGELHKVFRAFVEETNQNCSGRTWGAVSARKKFILIAAYIYAPGMLLGDCMPKRLRIALTGVLNLHSSTSISNYWSDALFFYWNYRDYREEIEAISRGILNRLGVASE